MIVDSHIHAGHGKGLTDSWNTFEDIELSLKRMDESGIDRAVILPIENLDYRIANREIAEIAPRVGMTHYVGIMEDQALYLFDRLVANFYRLLPGEFQPKAGHRINPAQGNDRCAANTIQA